jgi:hypothetical protein
MIEEKPIGPISPPVTDNEAMRKRLEQGKAEEDKIRKAEKNTPFGVTRHKP